MQMKAWKKDKEKYYLNNNKKEPYGNNKMIMGIKVV